MIAYNPCDDIRVPKRRKQDTDEQVIACDVFRHKLLPAVPDRYRGLVAVAGGAGLRWGEAAGLCADAVDLDAGRLRVIRTVVEVAGHTRFKGYPKSTAGRRTIPSARLARRDPPRTCRAVRVRRSRPALRQWSRRHPPADPVPSSAMATVAGQSRTAGLGDTERHPMGRHLDRRGRQATSGPMRDRKRRRRSVARRQAGGLRYHDLRHSYATWLVDDGVPPNMVQRVMGHERASTTLDLYTRRTDDADRILRALDDAD